MEVLTQGLGRAAPPPQAPRETLWPLPASGGSMGSLVCSFLNPVSVGRRPSPPSVPSPPLSLMLVLGFGAHPPGWCRMISSQDPHLNYICKGTLYKFFHMHRFQRWGHTLWGATIQHTTKDRSQISLTLSLPDWVRCTDFASFQWSWI